MYVLRYEVRGLPFFHLPSPFSPLLPHKARTLPSCTRRLLPAVYTYAQLSHSLSSLCFASSPQFAACSIQPTAYSGQCHGGASRVSVSVHIQSGTPPRITCHVSYVVRTVHTYACQWRTSLRHSISAKRHPMASGNAHAERELPNSQLPTANCQTQNVYVGGSQATISMHIYIMSGQASTKTRTCACACRKIQGRSREPHGTAVVLSRPQVVLCAARPSPHCVHCHSLGPVGLGRYTLTLEGKMRTTVTLRYIQYQCRRKRVRSQTTSLRLRLSLSPGTRKRKRGALRER